MLDFISCLQWVDVRLCVFFYDVIHFPVLSTCFDAIGAGIWLGGVLFVCFRFLFLLFSEVGSTEPPQSGHGQWYIAWYIQITRLRCRWLLVTMGNWLRRLRSSGESWFNHHPVLVDDDACMHVENGLILTWHILYTFSLFLSGCCCRWWSRLGD